MKPGFFDRVKAFFQSWIESAGVKEGPSKANIPKKAGSPDKPAGVRTEIAQTQGAARRATLFSDAEIAGTAEKKQSIPGKNESGAMKRQSGADPVRDKFIADMHLFADREGAEAEYVPLDGAATGYDSLSADQLNWYFCWRSLVRAERYPETSQAYILIHAQEMLNGCGWESAADGLDRFVRLWMNYRERFPQLDQDMFGWAFDFACQHQLDFTPDQVADIPEKIWPAVRNLLVDRHRKDKPLKLSMPLVEEISAYSVRDSRFYNDGHQQLMEEAIPRVIALADAALLKKHGKGILQQYGPRVGKKQRYCVYANAAHPMADQHVEVTVRAYVHTPQLRQYIGELIRYAENVLRGMYKYRGRLRVENLDSEMAALIEGFLKKEYDPDKEKEPEKEKRVEVRLDFDSIDLLRAQSDAVREALEVAEEPETPVVLAEEEQTTETPISHETDEQAAYFDAEKLSDRMRQLTDALAELQQAALRIVLVSDEPLEQLSALAEEALTMPEILIDEINDAAMQALDDILIDAFGDVPRVLEQYENELKDAVVNGG